MMNRVDKAEADVLNNAMKDAMRKHYSGHPAMSDFMVRGAETINMVLPHMPAFVYRWYRKLEYCYIRCNG